MIKKEKVQLKQKKLLGYNQLPASSFAALSNHEDSSAAMKEFNKVGNTKPGITKIPDA